MEKITAITGNIGSGKSKVMEILESRGYKHSLLMTIHQKHMA